MLISTLPKEDIIDIDIPDRICSLTFDVDEFSGLFLHPSISSIIHSKSEYIINGTLTDFWHWFYSNILVSLEGIKMLSKSLF